MTNSTLEYYEEHAEQFIHDTLNKDMSTCYEAFEKYLHPNAHILDAGCGSGRDSLYFKSRGFQCSAFDISFKMSTFASALLGQEVLQLSFDELHFQDKFDAVWASASLLHVPKEKMPSVMKKLSQALRPRGVIYASFKHGDSESMRGKRFFNAYTQKSFNDLIEPTPFRLEESFLLEDTRPERKGEFWLNCICVNDK